MINMERIYDVVIIGGGPAGYSAALYAARAGLDTLVLERLTAGGQMTETPLIENYPGVAAADGFALGEEMKAAAERFGAATRRTEVTALSLSEMPRKIETDGGVLLSRTVILATGAVHRHLGIAREEEFIGRGLGYCAACDGMLFRGKTVAVVGGGNSAVSDALYLSRICARVYLIHRRDTLRAERVYQNALASAENIEILWNTTVEALHGDERLSGVTLQSKESGARTELALDGLFVSVGRAPASALAEGQLALDAGGYILAGEDTKTSVPGVFAAGDVRTKPFRQIVTAAADGAVAAHMAEEYLAAPKGSL